MAEPYLGQIQIVAFNFAPRGWFLCNGQTLAIQQYTALFSLIGTYYGGNGTSTFQLPNLQGRVPIHQGTGPGLSTYVIGEQGGVENVTLLYNNMPIHNHLLNVTSVYGKSGNPSGLFLANTEEGSGRGEKAGNYDFVSTAANATMAAGAVSQSGGSVPHANIQPYLTLNFIIAYTGVYPSRN
jgi:microcystin-dependent protein